MSIRPSDAIPGSLDVENVSYTRLQHAGVDDRLGHCDPHLGTEQVDGLWREAAPAQGRQCEQARIIPVPGDRFKFTHKSHSICFVSSCLDKRKPIKTIKKLSKHGFIILKTRGPKVAHLRKRSMVKVEPFTEDH